MDTQYRYMAKMYTHCSAFTVSLNCAVLTLCVCAYRFIIPLNFTYFRSRSTPAILFKDITINYLAICAF